MSSTTKADGVIDQPAGEILFLLERLIVAPARGTFRRLDGAEAGHPIARNDLIGVVQSLRTATLVRSPFGGLLVGFLAFEGEKVRRGQALAWLRTT